MKKLIILVPCFMAFLVLGNSSFAQTLPQTAESVSHSFHTMPPLVLNDAPAASPCACQGGVACPCQGTGCACGCAMHSGMVMPNQGLRARFAERRAARVAYRAQMMPAPYQQPMPYPQIPTFTTAVEPSLVAAPAPQGYYPQGASSVAGRNALQRNMSPIVINFMSLFRSARNPYDPYAGYYPQTRPYPYQRYPVLPAGHPVQQ